MVAVGIDGCRNPIHTSEWRDYRIGILPQGITPKRRRGTSDPELNPSCELALGVSAR